MSGPDGMTAGQRSQAERDECVAKLRAPEGSGIPGLLQELRGHVEHTCYWDCETHGHQTRADEILDILDMAYRGAGY